ncbi:MAG TPA: glycosyltransferase [Candidatus Saccharimonadales bacterium]|nr:glycosyltransferase [Candidatus Saccharimonadales bacterium]
MLSVVIPSRSDQYLQRTIDDLLEKAEGEVEIIVTLDGYWPNPMLRDDPRVIILHHGQLHNHVGMRGGINAAMEIASGDYVMKIDEHCMVDQGFDLKLAADCEDNWVVIPRRYRLDPDAWQLIEDGRPPVDYMYLASPFRKPDDVLYGLHGALWNERHHERKDNLIDDTMSWQGSCYFMKKKYWFDLLHPLDDENYGPFTQEAQEIGNKVWLSGGRLVVNKKTWYAHYHKGKRGKGLGFSNEQYKRHQADTEKGRRYCIDFWLNNKWDKRNHDFEWLIEKFWPVPKWPDNWRQLQAAYMEQAYAN